ncbi:MAG: STAS domain-containing protein [Anaerolineae bacterium]
MLRSNVTMSVRKGSDTFSIVDVQGEFTGFAEDALMEAYTEASAGNARAIILNFAGLEYMNSSGIGLLATLLIRMNRQGQRLSVVGLSEHYRHIFELTRLDEAISIYKTEAEALEHLDGG